mmetsp:Transcript_11792/g.42173  ORF Transcript_11792/g.42173 Transcript_11792/m.42173 type:complete len:268 (+) Transcript_11792:1099-1902(+)
MVSCSTGGVHTTTPGHHWDWTMASTRAPRPILSNGCTHFHSQTECHPSGQTLSGYSSATTPGFHASCSLSRTITRSKSRKSAAFEAAVAPAGASVGDARSRRKCVCHSPVAMASNLQVLRPLAKATPPLIKKNQLLGMCHVKPMQSGIFCACARAAPFVAPGWLSDVQHSRCVGSSTGKVGITTQPRSGSATPAAPPATMRSACCHMPSGCLGGEAAAAAAAGATGKVAPHSRMGIRLMCSGLLLHSSSQGGRAGRKMLSGRLVSGR